HSMSSTSNRDKALDAALAQIDKSYGKGSIMRLGDDVRAPIEVVPTGSVALDIALAIGGLQRGWGVVFYGPACSGKTTIALRSIAATQRKGGIAAYTYAEPALDTQYATKLVVGSVALLVSQPDSVEQVLEIMDMLFGSGALF